MAGFNSKLYGKPKPKNSISTTITATSEITLADELARMASSASTTTRGRKRASSSKTDDLFKRGSNKGVASRAARDLDKTISGDIGYTEDAQVRAGRKKMEEKSRLYSAMQRGDAPPVKRARTNGYDQDDAPGSLIDWERRRMEREQDGEQESSSGGDDDDDSDAPNDDNDLVEVVDELGRTRRMTKKDLRKQEREENRFRGYHPPENDEDRVFPTMPSNIIRGDVIQAEAFDEDDFARKQYALDIERVKEEKTQGQTHYDADWEIRTKGVAFYQFSKDEEERNQQMNALKKEREETQKHRAEKENKNESRKKEIEARRQELAKRRSQKQANAFLEGLKIPETDEEKVEKSS